MTPLGKPQGQNDPPRRQGQNDPPVILSKARHLERSDRSYTRFFPLGKPQGQNDLLKLEKNWIYYLASILLTDQKEFLCL